MRRTHLLVVGFVVAAVLPSATVAGAQDEVLPKDVKVVWEMSKAYRETSPMRERICINGLWRWQPADEKKIDAPPSDNWGYFKVPGPWPDPKVSQWPSLEESQRLYRHPSWKDKRLNTVDMAWYEREITVPKNWTGRTVTLSADYLSSYAQVFIDGKRAGEVYYPGGEVDVTSFCKPGQKQLLSVLTATAPRGQKFADYLAAAPGKRGSVAASRGLCGDVFLSSKPAAARLGDLKIITSVRKWELQLDAAVLGLAEGRSYMLRGQIFDRAQEVKSLESRPFTASDLAGGRFAFADGWHPDKLWDTITPENQFDLKLALLDDKGAVVDELLPVRFGFREIWFDGRDCRLNGTRLHWFAMPLDNGMIGPAAANYEVAKETFLRAKAAGYNLMYTHNYFPDAGVSVSTGELLRAADDTGVLISFSLPGSYIYHNFPSPYDKITPDKLTNGYFTDMSSYVVFARNHPSVALWFMTGGGYPQDQNPYHLGEKLGEIDVNMALVLATERLVHLCDDTRPIYHHAGGNKPQMHGSNCYLNWMPIQERSDYYAHWAAEGVKPVFHCEYGLPMDESFINCREGYQILGSSMALELCSVEWGAQFRGDAAYKLPDEEKENIRFEATHWKNRSTYHKGQYPFFEFASFPNIKEVLAMYVADNWPAFRTLGVTGTNAWGQMRYWHPRAGVDRSHPIPCTTDWDAIQRPGFSPDFMNRRYYWESDGQRSDWVPDATGKAIIDYNRPVLAYIAGKTSHVTGKDHNCLPGETIEKQLIVINDSRRPIQCEVAWTLGLSTPVKGSKNLSIETGELGRIPLSLSIPADTKPGHYLLSMTAKLGTGETQEDSFPLDVLALPQKPAVAGKAAIFDPRGETTRLLDTLGVKAEAIKADTNLSGYDLLIIGKKALTPFGPAPDITRVRDGLKVVVFEQTQEALEKRLGFRTQEYGLRQVFPRLIGQPVLRGLTAENLANWRGEATTMPPQNENPVYYGGAWNHGVRAGLENDRAWRVGCYGNVASVLIEKPGCGDFLPLVDGGFALQYSPLMEYREGQGRVLFCQLDVTGRSETDPAAMRIVANLLEYAALCGPLPRRTVLYAGDALGKAHLDHCGLKVADYAGAPLTQEQVLIAGPGSGQKLHANAAAIAKWLAAGGNLLAVALDDREANTFLPFKVTMKKAEHIAASIVPAKPDSLFAGVAPADVYTRDAREIPLVAGGATPLGDGILAEGPAGHVVFCQIAPWQYDYNAKNGAAWQLDNKDHYIKWTYQRSSFLLSRLLGNMGAGAATLLLDRFGKPALAGESIQDLLDAPWIEDGKKELALPTHWKGLAIGRGMNKNPPDGWQSPEFDDSPWKPIRLPGMWDEQYAGLSLDVRPWSFYQRVSFSVPADMLDKDVTLVLGSVEVDDWTYVNGQQVGSFADKTGGREKFRQYTIPKGLLKPGKNVLAMKIFTWGNHGGLYVMDRHPQEPHRKARLEHPLDTLAPEAVRYLWGLYPDLPYPVDDPYRYFRW